MDRAGSRYFYHQNTLWTVHALTDATGTVVERVTYDAYGMPSFFDSSFIPHPSSLVNNRLLFTGREWDAECSLYHYRARTYSPMLGRFLSRDPLGYVDGINLYLYVLNQPMASVDPYGLVKFNATTTFFKWDRSKPGSGAKIQTAYTTLPKVSVIGDAGNISYSDKSSEATCCWECKLNSPGPDWFSVSVKQLLPEGVDTASSAILEPILIHEAKRLKIDEWAATILQDTENLIFRSTATGETQDQCRYNLLGRINCLASTGLQNFYSQVHKWQKILGGEKLNAMTLNNIVTHIIYEQIAMPVSLSDAEWNPDLEKYCAKNSKCP
jgi:RHS repeat-associated protein